MIARSAAATAKSLAAEFTVVAIVGPRQAGKTTLARAVFAGKPYVSMESPDSLRFATEDARGFLARYPDGAVIGEAQRCPAIFPCLRGIVDGRRRPGRFVLTGSGHFGLMEKLTRSPSGRAGSLRLLPLSLRELENGGCAPDTVESMIFKGGYPPLYDQPVQPQGWLDGYITTYVERDVRQVINVRDLGAFQLFVRVCAGNVGRLLNLSRIGADAGIDQKTARAWLGMLESSFIAFRLQPHRRSFGKRLVKTPKLYFYDAALAARLLGIESPQQIATHPLRGALFENWAITELMKARGAEGKADNLYFWRNNVGHEVDVIAAHGRRLMPIAIKTGALMDSEWFTDLMRWSELAGVAAEPACFVHDGALMRERKGARVVPWSRIGDVRA